MNGNKETSHTKSTNTLLSSESECPPVVSQVQKTNSSRTDLRWFVMRSTYSREMKAKEMLEKDGIECFVPTKRVRHIKGEDAIDENTPIVHNLIFVYTSRDFMDTYKRRMESICPLRYAMDRATAKPMVVRDKEMQDFMRVTQEANDSIRYLDDPEELLRRGQDVEIIAGPFEGVRGKIVRFHRDRRVVVSLAGILAVAMSSMPITWLKITTNH